MSVETLAAGDGTLAAPGDKPVYTLDQVIASFTRWDARWLGPTIPYSFYEQRPDHRTEADYNGFFAFSAAQRQALTSIFQLISDIIPLNFVNVPDNQTEPDFGNNRITYANSSTIPQFVTAWTLVGYEDRGAIPDRAEIPGAEIWFNPNRAVGTYDMGFRNFMVLIHETLHALGLPHPSDYNRSPTEEITYAQHAQFMQDSLQYSVLSYFGAQETGAQHNGRFAATPLLYDIAALQALYGANTATRADDTVYGFHSTAGRAALDFNLNTQPVVSLWDGGGIDTLDLSGFATSSFIDLTPGAFSNAGGLTSNISIAYGVTIENAIGGTANDTLIGNEAANRLTGGGGDDLFAGRGGDDTLDGGGGLDTAAHFNRAADYAWWEASPGSWRVQDLSAGGVEGLDTLISVEQLQFSDRTIRIIGATPAQALGQAFENLLRYQAVSGADATYLAGLATSVAGGARTLTQAYGDLVQRADGTAAVAALSYEFFTGHAPSKAGFDYLLNPAGANPNNLNSAYYQSFSIENRYINFAVNLGVGGEGRVSFEAQYGGLSLFDATKTAYARIFGGAPTDAKIHQILDASVTIGGAAIARSDYFAIYGGDGVEGLGTKAAAIGFLLTEAIKADLGVFALSSNAYLADLADGAQYLVDIVGVYGRPEWAFSG